MNQFDEIGGIGPIPNSDATNQKGINLFFGDAEAAFFSSAGREITENIVQESMLLYRVDLEKTSVHPLYGEAKRKVWEPEVRIFGRIDVDKAAPTYQVAGGIEKKGMGELTAHIYIEHLEELGLLLRKDNNQAIVLDIRTGSFLAFKGQFYKVVDDGYSQLSNEFAWAGDRRFYVTIKAIEVDEDIFQGR
jgi:hypothetical protein